MLTSVKGELYTHAPTDLGILCTSARSRQHVSNLDATIKTLADIFSGNDSTDNFFKAAGINQNQFNVVQQLLSLGIILLEVPPNTCSTKI